MSLEDNVAIDIRTYVCVCLDLLFFSTQALEKKLLRQFLALNPATSE